MMEQYHLLVSLTVRSSLDETFRMFRMFYQLFQALLLYCFKPSTNSVSAEFTVKTKLGHAMKLIFFFPRKERSLLFPWSPLSITIMQASKYLIELILFVI